MRCHERACLCPTVGAFPESPASATIHLPTPMHTLHSHLPVGGKERLQQARVTDSVVIPQGVSHVHLLPGRPWRVWRLLTTPHSHYASENP